MQQSDSDDTAPRHILVSRAITCNHGRSAAGNAGNHSGRKGSRSQGAQARARATGTGASVGRADVLVAIGRHGAAAHTGQQGPGQSGPQRRETGGQRPDPALPRGTADTTKSAQAPGWPAVITCDCRRKGSRSQGVSCFMRHTVCSIPSKWFLLFCHPVTSVRCYASKHRTRPAMQI